ncbi:hypothetical protein Ciccas_003531 [Cichlidogyrus casuarinus]|uniref:USP domain-containing protein n=1 Tax=Cichlidogyrus casuarinus TaxID=1844966 RepID=A0ABD2QHF4_9PLAT
MESNYESIGQSCSPECRRVLTVSEVINWPQVLVIAFRRAYEIQISAYETLKKPDSTKFKLKAVFVYTTSPRHYYVLALRGKCWFCLNDSRVTGVESTALQFCSSMNAILSFYCSGIGHAAFPFPVSISTRLSQ